MEGNGQHLISCQILMLLIEIAAWLIPIAVDSMQKPSFHSSQKKSFTSVWLGFFGHKLRSLDKAKIQRAGKPQLLVCNPVLNIFCAPQLPRDMSAVTASSATHKTQVFSHFLIQAFHSPDCSPLPPPLDVTCVDYMCLSVDFYCEVCSLFFVFPCVVPVCLVPFLLSW